MRRHKNYLFIPLTVLIFSPNAAAAPPVEVRVLVAENQKTIKLTVRGDYVIRSLPSLQVLRKGGHLIEEPVSPAAAGIKLGKSEYPVRGLRIEPQNDRDLILNRSVFRGSMDILKSGPTSLDAINRIDIESYLYGVLHHEVAPWWPMEALKAQAIAARTYAYYQSKVSKSAEYDLKSSTFSQVYGGSTTERYRAKNAVNQTRGEILVYEGKVFPAYFHATCGGMTAGAKELWKIDLRPLSGGSRCTFCRISPHFYWEAKIPLSEIEEKMKLNGRPVGRLLKMEIITQTPSGRVGSLHITGTAGDTVMAAKDFRIWLGGDKLRSTAFTVEIEDDTANFHGKGWGHGVGLCQWGALGQSLLGHSHEKILQFYYPGSQIIPYDSQ